MNRILLILLAVLTVPMIGCVDPEPTTFLMSNGGDELVYRWDVGPITLTADGERASFSKPTCSVPCGKILTGGIACAEAAQLQSAVELPPGDTFEMSWDGTYYEIDQERGCYIERTRGADFQVEFCYGYEIEGAFEGEPENGVHAGASIVDPVCEQVAFERGGVVDLIAE